MPTWDDDPYYVIAFGVHKSRRYHMKMWSFFQRLSDLVLGLNAILGAGAFIALLGGKDGVIVKVLIGTVAVGSALDNVLGFATKAKLHADLCRKFTELASKMAIWDATEENYRKAVSERIMIEKDEPPVHRLVDIDARNEELRSRGNPAEDLIPLSWSQSIFGYVFTFGMKQQEAWYAGRATNRKPS